MPQRPLVFLLLVVSVFIISCKRQVKQSYLHNTSIAIGFDQAKKERKGLILIANRTGCSTCEQFEVDLMKDQAYAEKLYKDFVIQRVDGNAAGQKWLSRILNAGGVPVFIFFNDKGRLLGIKEGATSKLQMQQIIQRVKSNQYSIDPRYKFGKANLIASRQLPVYFENLCIAHAKWDRYSTTNRINALNGIEKELNNAIRIRSSFYNNYLLARYNLAKNDTIKAREAAARALLDEDPASLYFNAELRPELKMILNKKYSIYDDAYIGVNSIEKQLGTIEFGSIKQIMFRIKNLGNEDLIINKVLPDCGCTVANYTRTNIKPGAYGNVGLTFRAENQGEFAHAVYLQSNAINGPIQLYIKGLVMGN